MDNLNPLSEFKNNGKQTPPPYPLPLHFAQSYTNFPIVDQKGISKLREGLGSSHHRCPSESLLLDGQPSWLDDLLNETETEIPQKQAHKGHRRSASDTFAYVESAAKAFDMQEENHYKNVAYGTPITAQTMVSYKDFNQGKFEIKPMSLEEKLKKDLTLADSTTIERHDKGESTSQNPEGSAEGSSQNKAALSKTDAKRAKQQSAHRSRVRKLQYIAQLEKTVQLLQAEGSEIAAELEFVDQQYLILSMENRSLKQRLDSLSQEQLIKQLEHEMLERELGRLQGLYQLQRQQEIQTIQHQNSRPRRNKNREASSIRGPTNS